MSVQVEASPKFAANKSSYLTLDPDTASGYLRLSDGQKTATRGSWQDRPEKPERFNPYPQVLCEQYLIGRNYFEVEWSAGAAVGVGLAYDSIPRKGDGEKNGFGFNNVSWYFGINNNNFKAWHDNKSWSSPVPASGCTRIGVYLDYSGGSLSFYNVSSSILTPLYTFKAKFTEPLYPGLYVWTKDSYATICSV